MDRKKTDHIKNGLPVDFNAADYKKYNPDLTTSDPKKLAHHYIKHGKKEDRIYKLVLPEDFNVDSYKQLNPDLCNLSNEELMVHYIKHGQTESRLYKLTLPEEFCPNTYLKYNPDLTSLTEDQLKVHYITNGWREKRRFKLDLPKDFNPGTYRYLNPDLKTLNKEQLEIHYNDVGHKENRQYKQLSSAEIKSILTSITPKTVDIILVNHDSSQISGGAHSLYIMANELKQHKKVLILESASVCPKDVYSKYEIEDVESVCYHNDPIILYTLYDRIKHEKIMFNSINFTMREVINQIPKSRLILFSREIKKHYEQLTNSIPDYVITSNIAETYKNVPKVQTPILPIFLQKIMDREILESVEINLEDKITIGMCGNTVERKNINLFLQVAKMLPKYNFVWIGGTSQIEHDLTNFVHIHETLYPYKYYKLIDYFVLFSKHEPFGNVVIENLYYNKKVLAFRDNVCYNFKHKMTENVYIEFPGEINLFTAIQHITTHATKRIPLNANYKTSDSYMYVTENFSNYKSGFINSLFD